MVRCNTTFSVPLQSKESWHERKNTVKFHHFVAMYTYNNKNTSTTTAAAWQWAMGTNLKREVDRYVGHIHTQVVLVTVSMEMEPHTHKATKKENNDRGFPLVPLPGMCPAPFPGVNTFCSSSIAHATEVRCLHRQSCADQMPVSWRASLLSHVSPWVSPLSLQWSTMCD